MTKRFKILLIGLAIALIIFAVSMIFGQKEFDRIAIGDYSNPTVVSNNIFSIKEKRAVSIIDLNTGDETEIKVDGKVVDYYISPNGKRMIVSVFINESFTNYLVDLSTNKRQEIESCWATIAWDDNEHIYANCAVSEFEYDPNIINNLVYAKPEGTEAIILTKFNFPFPKKLISVKNGVVVVPNDPGYGSNDLMFFDKFKRSLSPLTENGFIWNAKTTSDSKIIYSLGFDKSGLFSLDLDTSQSKTISNDIDKIELVDSNSNGTYILNPDAKSITYPTGRKVKIDNKIGSANSLVIQENGILIFSETGIFKKEI